MTTTQNVLLAGASGVLGRHITAALTASGHTVIGLGRSADADVTAATDAGMTAQVTASAGPQLAETGSDGASPFLRLAALLMLLGGAATMLIGRKRTAQRI